VFAHACRLGAEGIVSKKVDGAYQSGPCRVWIKVRNPASIAV
jgi:bifunctional non-homologous end joining protein LigD